MNPEPSPVPTSRRVRGLLYLCLAGVVVFLVTLYRGIAPLPYLASGILAGTLRLLCSSMASRFRTPLLSSVGMVLILLVYMFAKDLNPDRTNTDFIQWICVTYLTFCGGCIFFTLKWNRDASTV
jgi:hypothetical protein